LAAAFVGGLAVFPMSGVSEVRAAPEIGAAAHHAKADRLPALAKGTACSSRGWPHYERSCQFDMRRQIDEVRTVRIVSLRSSTSN
jgi:hypothetical protein